MTTDFARTEGWRNVTGETSVPSRIRSVRVARAASVAQASSDYIFDDSQLARAKELITDIRTKLEVAAKLANADVNVQAEIPLQDSAPADITITATGLNLLALGGMELSVDGREVDPSQALTYRGMMISDVPNLALAVGYTNASWTLKADLICRYVARLLSHMDARGYTQATPRPERTDGPAQPFLNLTSGYVQRAVDQFPRQGAEAPWRIHQNYLRDIALIRRGDLEEGMEFAAAQSVARPAERLAA